MKSRCKVANLYIRMSIAIAVVLMSLCGCGKKEEAASEFAGEERNAAEEDTVLVFPQFVTGGGYISVITLVNPSSTATVTGTLSFFNQDGTPRSVAIDGQPTATSLPGIKIPPGGTVSFSTAPGGSQTVAGMVKFTSDSRTGGVVRFIFPGGQVGVLSAAPVAWGTLVLNTSGGNDTGVAVANPGIDPVNIRMTYLDENGTAVETVDPPELNPLKSNGQIAKFATQFGFKQVANKDKGSIQIKVKGMGEFSAFALLLKDGALSSTAVIPGGPKLAPIFNATYPGTWTNSTTGAGGSITLQAAVDTDTGTAVGTITVTGDLFSSGAAGGFATFAGSFNRGVFKSSATSAFLGLATLTVNYADGTFTLKADSLPYTNACSFELTGSARLDQILANFLISYNLNDDTNGTITLKQGTIKLQ